jgi:hypothetical protein
MGIIIDIEIAYQTSLGSAPSAIETQRVEIGLTRVTLDGIVAEFGLLHPDGIVWEILVLDKLICSPAATRSAQLGSRVRSDPIASRHPPRTRESIRNNLVEFADAL